MRVKQLFLNCVNLRCDRAAVKRRVRNTARKHVPIYVGPLPKVALRRRSTKANGLQSVNLLRPEMLRVAIQQLFTDAVAEVALVNVVVVDKKAVAFG